MAEETDKPEPADPAAAKPAVPAAAPAEGKAPTPPPAKPAPPPPSPPPAEMIDKKLRVFLEKQVASGETITIETKRGSFTGRLFKMLLEEGWIALEHVDGRRRAYYLIEGGTISSPSGESFDLPSLK